MSNRLDLEAQALETVSATNYYDLADNIATVSDDDLQRIIDCNGDYDKECDVA